MPSIARHHFPQFIWRNGEKLLWNPIKKKGLKNRPEERVRLRIIEALVEADWSKHRISTEEAIAAADERGRTDIICYDRNFTPKILIECKAENVPISSKVAEQTARYNRSVEAPFLLMSNGVSDFWYQITGRHIQRLDTIPDILNTDNETPKKEFAYWRIRGFAGDKARPALRDWLEAALPVFWFETDGKARFLTFRHSPTDIGLTHYFKIFKPDENKIALGFLNTPFGGTRLFAIFNRDEENVGMIEINLDLLSDGRKPNSTCYSTTWSGNFYLQDYISFDIASFDKKLIRNLPVSLKAAFESVTGY